MRRYFGSSPPSVSKAERNMSLLIINSNSVFNYPIPLMPSIVTIHSLHVKTTNDPLPIVSNRYSLSFRHNICRLHLSAEYVTDCENFLAVKHVCKSALDGAFLGQTNSYMRITWIIRSWPILHKPRNCVYGFRFSYIFSDNQCKLKIVVLEMGIRKNLVTSQQTNM
jgi:hypothetical protein